MARCDSDVCVVFSMDFTSVKGFASLPNLYLTFTILVLFIYFLNIYQYFNWILFLCSLFYNVFL